MIAETPNLLLVDDEPAVLKSLSRIMELNGFRVLCAGSAMEAMDVLSRESVDLVISDHKMPVMSGLELMITIHKKYPDIIRVLLTAYSEEQLMKRAINEGNIHRFLNKPWNEDELLSAVRSGVGKRLEVARKSGILQEQLNRSNLETVMALAEAIELKDIYTKGHCSRVRDYAFLIAQELELPRDEMENLAYGALLHDCGKIGIPEEILLKSSPLTRDELVIIQSHSILGFDMTNRVSHLKTASIFIRQHHERWDGNGYPDGLVRDESHICSRIIGIADAFDAMTSDRPYRRGMDTAKAMKIMKENRGTQFDPDLVDIFVSVMGKKHPWPSRAGYPAYKDSQRSVILFVDDDPTCLEEFTHRFKNDDYTLLTASTPEEALEHLKQRRADLVISNQKMIGKTGIHLLNTIKFRYPETVRIMFSCYADLNESMGVINEVGVFKFIRKPWKNDELETIIAKALEWKQMNRAHTTTATLEPPIPLL